MPGMSPSPPAHPCCGWHCCLVWGCHPVPRGCMAPRGMSPCPWCGVSLSPGWWWHTVPGMVRCHPQDSVTVSDGAGEAARPRWGGQWDGHWGAAGVPAGAAPMGGHRPVLGQQPHGGEVQKPRSDICHWKGERWREGTAVEEAAAAPGVAAFAGGRKQLLGESKSGWKNKSKTRRRDRGPGSTAHPTRSSAVPGVVSLAAVSWGGEGRWFCPPAPRPQAAPRVGPHGRTPQLGPRGVPIWSIACPHAWSLPLVHGWPAHPVSTPDLQGCSGCPVPMAGPRAWSPHPDLIADPQTP
ncbi:hypothetical protein Q9966_003887 [Columba livia]|nr:hypothetical protein Q9966_003887 [Columba livia]